jgi:hypothetical protein
MLLMLLGRLCRRPKRFTSASASDDSTPHHGWVLASHRSPASSSTDQELWDRPESLCDAARTVAASLVAEQLVAEQLGPEKMAYLRSHGYQAPDPEIAGKYDLPAGTWVDIVGDESHMCSRTSTTFSFTKVRIRDGGSGLNNRVLYIQEGSLTHE